MNGLLERYADVILHSALKINKDDILAINTEEENLPLARIIAQKAKIITGNGSYLMILDHGKKTDVTEIYSDYLIQKQPTLFIYLQTFFPYGEIDDMEKELEARQIQQFRHLASPLFLPKPEIPFVTVPVPSASWGRAMDQYEGDERLSSVVISDLLRLDEENPEKLNDEMLEMNPYDLDNLNSESQKRHVRVTSYDGMTDLKFDFAQNSLFSSNLSSTEAGRKFCPSIFSSSYFRAVEKKSANGRVSVTKPFLLFGRQIGSLTLFFENGRVNSFETDEESAELFNYFLSLDPQNAFLAEISIAEESNNANSIPYFAYPEWDRMRTTHITLGCPKPECLGHKDEKEADQDGIASSICYLSLPIGCDELEIRVHDDNGDETVLFEDGLIAENY